MNLKLLEADETKSFVRRETNVHANTHAAMQSQIEKSKESLVNTATVLSLLLYKQINYFLFFNYFQFNLTGIESKKLKYFIVISKIILPSFSYNIIIIE